ncbi:hypothetical protein OXYTRIMIC_794 [Oxytricha trifallax]|uniref:Uncharacterized protein n=1 Tax=Oxytricha trifallax TaxID=1172189 RepID=A0A073HZN7_9SPIT|nr:hypothetical protein OXYTRIMIC_794 [Oxytricha trifallax]
MQNNQQHQLQVKSLKIREERRTKTFNPHYTILFSQTSNKNKKSNLQNKANCQINKKQQLKAQIIKTIKPKQNEIIQSDTQAIIQVPPQEAKKVAQAVISTENKSVSRFEGRIEILAQEQPIEEGQEEEEKKELKIVQEIQKQIDDLPKPVETEDKILPPDKVE